MCPSTRQVSLYVDEDLGHLLSPLHSLGHLQELKLLACNFYSDRVDRLVREQGHRLTLLHLEHVDELDMSALSLIALCCPALEKLVFFSCDFVENFGSSPEGFPEPPFRQLTHLVCVSESAPNVIEFLLVTAENLKSVQFGSTAWFNDQIVSNVLASTSQECYEAHRGDPDPPELRVEHDGCSTTYCCLSKAQGVGRDGGVGRDRAGGTGCS